MILGHCPFCGKEVIDRERRYYEVMGWEEERRQGGTNALRLRSRTGAVAHHRCVDSSAHGRHGQEELEL